jgi:hypothetical protein
MAINFPSNYKFAGEKAGSKSSTDDPRLWYPSQLKEGEKITLRPCGSFESGHWVHGSQYFTLEGQCKRSPVRPKEADYIDEIGWKYKKSPSDTDSPEKSFPIPFLGFTAICKQRKEVLVVTIDKATIREAIERALAREDTHITPDGILNIEFDITKTGTGINTKYAVDSMFKAPTQTHIKTWKSINDNIWTQALFEGANPFDGKPAESKLKGLPPTARDELGADKEISSDMPGEDDW